MGKHTQPNISLFDCVPKSADPCFLEAANSSSIGEFYAAKKRSGRVVNVSDPREKKLETFRAFVN